MFRAVLLGLGLAACAAPVQGQSYGDPTCNPKREFCSRAGSSSARDTGESGLDRHEETMESLRRVREAALRAKAKKIEKAVSKAVLEGRCDDARRIALEGGDLDAADKAARLCAPAASNTPAAAPAS